MSKLLNIEQAFFTVKLMKDYGGSFAKQLAKTYEVADLLNKDKLLRTFAAIFTTYYDQLPLYYKIEQYEDLCKTLQEKYKDKWYYTFIKGLPFEINEEKYEQYERIQSCKIEGKN